MQDMFLLHHWTRHASRSITTSVRADELWQGVFPRIAFQHAFVLSALLSLSALHLAHLHEQHRKFYLIEAARHNHDAVKGLRESLEHITPEISDALFACASLNSVYLVCSCNPPNPSASTQMLTRFTHLSLPPPVPFPTTLLNITLQARSNTAP